MLVFDDQFVLSGQRNCCNLWAREPKLNRICFSIHTNLLPHEKGTENQLVDLAELQFCDVSDLELKQPADARSPIEPAG